MNSIYKFLLCSTCLLTSFSVLSQKLPPVIEWQKSLGGSKIDRAFSVIRTLDNGYFVAGLSFSNDGQVSGHHGSTDSSDAWVVKLDSRGNIQWQKSLGGTGTDDLRHVVQAPNGDFICTGFSTSNDGDVSGAKGQGDLWACRLSSSGTLLWSKLYGGPEADYGQAIRKAVDGGYIIAGRAFSQSGDITNHIGWSDVWMLKINDNGIIQWQKKYGSYNDQYVNDLIVTSDSSYIVTGYSVWRGEPTCIGSPMYALYAAYSLKVDRNSNIVWQNISSLSCGNPGSSTYSASTIEMPSTQLFRIGHRINASTEGSGTVTLSRATAQNQTVQTYSQNFNSLLSFPSILASSTPLNANNAALLPDSSIIAVMAASPYQFSGLQGTLVKINTKNAGSVINVDFKKGYGGTNDEVFRALDVINEAEYIVAGYSNSNNGDVSGNHGDYDFWVVKFNELNTIKGTVFVDNNGNGIKDGADNFFPNVRVTSTKGSATIASTTTSTGQFLNRVDTGTYSTTVNLIKPYFTINPASKTSVFANYNTKDSFGFALVPIPNKRDLRVTVTSTSLLRPGFNATYAVSYINEGTEVINDVVIKLVLPFNMDFVSSVPANSTYANDTVTWNIGTLSPLANATINVTVKADPPPALSIGDVAMVIAIAEPVTGDQTPLDNRDSSRRAARGSYDPNDKSENVNGTLRPDQIGQQYLTYTIRFQNTGTDTAFNIIIRDTLDVNLDWQTLEMIDASHANHFAIKESNMLAWTFTNILLPDSNTNEPLSHGYVIYRIKPKSALVTGDEVKNTASIYFDFNPPVQTNTTQTIVRPVLVPQPSVSGVAANYCSMQGIQRGKLNNLPAAGSSVTAMVKLNGNNLAIAADSTFGFDVGTLAAGAHVIEVIYTNGTENKTTTINFNITAAVTPDVNVSASNTTLVNLIDPVTITAANAAGGGSAPLYTFGKDRNFSNLWQAESSNNVLNIDPTALQNGDNWIYVRMKTSSTCFTAQANVDSIKIILQLPVPNQPVITGINANYCANEGVQKAKIANYPAPGTGSTTTAKIDGNAVTISMADTSFSFNATTLGAGAHVAEVTFTNPSGTKTSTLNFTVAALVTPDVNVSASSTTLVNLIDPVVITAANAAGGGSSPLYTFGKDRNFTNVWQAEGSNNVVNIAPTALQNGDNWIYVRMKTSSTCFTAQTNIDSIKITLQLPVPNQPVVSGINASYCANQGLQKAKITNYPAAGTGSTITAKVDGNAVTIGADSSFSFNVSILGAGNHTAEVTFTNPSGTKTTTVNFSVTALVTPDVNVTATANANPVVITATNASGGGQTPLYTFARNRTFTDLLQAEGTAATLTVPQDAFRLGENWIYVRMKTSSTCASQQTAIDSVKITRFGSRGLVDPDYPGQTITSSPNPFHNQLNVFGLSADKSYTLILYSQQGKIVRKVKVVGRTVAMVQVPGLSAGSYLLSIYDETKKRLIGTISLVKQ